MRSTGLVVVTSQAAVLMVGPDERVLTLETAQPAEWSRLMQALAKPACGAALSAVASSIHGLAAPVWDGLITTGCVLEAADEAVLVDARQRMFAHNCGFHFLPREPACDHLVIACTGSIVAGLIAPTVLSLWYSRFARQLDIVLTEAARTFVTRDLFESYGIRTWTDAFERRDGINVPHVQLARSAACILVMPASANALHRLADGACSDLLSLAVAATRAPVVLAPAMNDAMWNSRAVQRNVALLRADGAYVIEPTVIFGAADVASQGEPMYGGHGTLWSGPQSLMAALIAISDDRRHRLAGVPLGRGTEAAPGAR